MHWLGWLAIVSLTTFMVWEAVITRDSLDEAYDQIDHLWREIREIRQPPAVRLGPPADMQAYIRGIVADSLMDDAAWHQAIDSWVASQGR